MDRGSSVKAKGAGQKLLAIAHGAWPGLAALFLFFTFYSQIDSGGILDAGRWPSALLPSCDGGDPHCLAIREMDILIRIVTMCAALFAGLNLYDHVTIVVKANSVAHQSEAKRKLIEVVRYFSTYACFAGSTWWVAMTWNLKSDGGSFAGEWTVIILYLIFAVTDLFFMLHSPKEKAEDLAVNYNYFFANAFFIDIPTLIGIFAIIQFSTRVIGHAFGPEGDEIVRAVSGGAIVMHVIASQIVLASLNVQLHLKRGVAI